MEAQELCPGSFGKPHCPLHERLGGYAARALPIEGTNDTRILGVWGEIFIDAKGRNEEEILKTFQTCRTQGPGPIKVMRHAHACGALSLL